MVPDVLVIVQGEFQSTVIPAGVRLAGISIHILKARNAVLGRAVEIFMFRIIL
jgi:hypothetical protein